MDIDFLVLISKYAFVESKHLSNGKYTNSVSYLVILSM
ncbi:hypothetical protein L291_2686 [Acinetobacter guillouiae MSP4-18]|nr:hypothetical protein L291_2686 [Acinetobacter guillouiae MSP4-18]